MSRTAIVREYVLDTHDELLGAVLAQADEVAASWDGDATTDRTAVVEPFEYALEAAGTAERLPAVLVGAVDALGDALEAEPVAAPPYVVITSRGPVLRATLDSGRLVIAVRAFEVERNPTRYVRGPTVIEEALGVAFKTR